MRLVLHTIFVFAVLTLGILNKLNSQPSGESDSLQTILQDMKNDTAKIDYMIKLADEFDWSDINKSNRFASEALKISEEINYTRGIAYAYYWFAKIFYKSDFSFAESLVFKSLNAAYEVNDSSLIAKNYNLKAIINMDIEEYDEALKFYMKSVDYYLKINKDSLAAGVYNNLGALYRKMKMDSIELDYYYKAFEINQKNGNNVWLIVNCLNLSFAYTRMDNLHKAKLFLDKSLDIAEQYDLNSQMSWVYMGFCHYYIKLKNYHEAELYAEKALELYQKQEDQYGEEDALIKLIDIQKELGKNKDALLYAVQAMLVQKSININRQQKAMEMLKLGQKFELEQRQKTFENELLLLAHKRKELRYLLIIIGSLLSLATFIFLFLMLRIKIKKKNLEKEKLSQEVEFKNKELTTNVMYTIEKNKVLNDITEELIQIEKEAIREETQDAIQRISKKIRKSIESEAWEEFEIRFQQVHNDFYESLAKDYPDLSTNEKRLCAFLRLDMSTKEISRITGQSISALETARIRLRRKLGISNTNTNLVSFLNKY